MSDKTQKGGELEFPSTGEVLQKGKTGTAKIADQPEPQPDNSEPGNDDGDKKADLQFSKRERDILLNAGDAVQKAVGLVADVKEKGDRFKNVADKAKELLDDIDELFDLANRCLRRGGNSNG